MSNAVQGRDWNGRGEVLLVDKPLDWTSFDVVKKTRSLFGIQKIGHAGTLDPRATGLLILCSGPKTKQIADFADLEKCYTGTMELGVVSASFDGETETVRRSDPGSVSPKNLETAVAEFRGTLLQVPPMYSAAKYAGKRLYTYARAGKTVTREPKEIMISEFTITEFENPFARFRVRCSKGTYIRSLVNDLGERLGCGAVLRALRRTDIGPFNVADAMTIDQLTVLRDQLREDAKTHEDSPTSH